MYNTDTICACATSVGSGAVSIIRISGPKCFEAVDSLVCFAHGSASQARGGCVKFGTISGLDDVLVSIFRAPHSYTGEDCAEIGCHASAYIVREILSRLCDLGVRIAEPGEFTRRAFLAGKMDLAQAEAVADLIGASSAAAHKIALTQVKGEYSSELAALRAELLELTSLVELELDFSEEDVEFADRSRLAALVAECIAKVTSLAASFRVGNAIKNGVPVAIVGAPNSGKSTLLNALVGDDRAIVSDIPGTTRDTIEESVTLGGVCFRFVDTAGIHESSDYVEKLGIERSLSAISSALVVICLLDGTAGESENSSILSLVRSKISSDQKLIVTYNKADLVAIPGSLAISAKTGFGLDSLKNAICQGFSGEDLGNAVIVTNQRHYEALHSALLSLNAVSAAIADNISGELLSQDLRSALSSLGSILGEISTDEVLGSIFSRFCIGK